MMNKKNCDRCGRDTERITTMSIFNEDIICIECKREERNDPDYDAACLAETQSLMRGESNFEGVYPNYKPLIRNFDK